MTTVKFSKVAVGHYVADGYRIKKIRHSWHVSRKGSGHVGLFSSLSEAKAFVVGA